MALMRWMEIAADSLYKAKLIRGFCHLYDGREAVVSGFGSCNYEEGLHNYGLSRSLYVLGRGGTLPEVFAELMGRQLVARKERVGLCISIRRRMGFMVVTASLSSDTARLFEALNMVALGIYPQYWSARIIIMEWELQSRGLPRVRHITSVDGMDVLAVKQVSWPLHVDPGSTYRTRDEISGVRQFERDPVERVSYFF
ncbi:hypothetical protein K1719_009381 [Acacia pycnantha]|nr:hypothetical protein K1719_009381 [Acacia pycnantha]